VGGNGWKWVEKGVFRGQEEADARCCPLENNNNNINKKGAALRAEGAWH